MNYANAPEFLGHTVKETGEYRQTHPGYQLERILGSGGQGAAYLATDLAARSEPDRHVALKLLVPPANRNSSEYQRWHYAFETEGSRTTRMDHPNVLRSFSYGRGEILNAGQQPVAERPIIIMPHLDGGSVEGYMGRHENRRIPLEQAVSFIGQAAAGLQYSHDRRILHRDIKPPNLLLQLQQGELNLKVADFGIAIHLHDGNTGTMTEQVPIGSLAYMAPEQIEGEAVRASDIYSLAIVAFELATGQRPFQGPALRDFLRQHLRQAPPRFSDISRLEPTEPLRAIEPLIRKGMAKEPSDRPAEIGAFGLDNKSAYEEGMRAQSRAAHHIPMMPGPAIGRVAMDPPGPTGTRRLPAGQAGWVVAYDELAERYGKLEKACRDLIAESSGTSILPPSLVAAMPAHVMALRIVNQSVRSKVNDLQERQAIALEALQELSRLLTNGPPFTSDEPTLRALFTARDILAGNYDPAAVETAISAYNERAHEIVPRKLSFEEYRAIMDTVSRGPEREGIHDQAAWDRATTRRSNAANNMPHVLIRGMRAWPLLLGRSRQQSLRSDALQYQLNLPPEPYRANGALDNQIAQGLTEAAHHGPKTLVFREYGKPVIKDYLARILARHGSPAEVLDIPVNHENPNVHYRALEVVADNFYIGNQTSKTLQALMHQGAINHMPEDAEVLITSPQALNSPYNKGTLLDQFLQLYDNVARSGGYSPRMYTLQKLKAILRDPGTVVAAHTSQGKVEAFTPFVFDPTVLDANIRPEYFAENYTGHNIMFTPGMICRQPGGKANDSARTINNMMIQRLASRLSNTHIIWRDAGAGLLQPVSEQHNNSTNEVVGPTTIAQYAVREVLLRKASQRTT